MHGVCVCMYVYMYLYACIYMYVSMHAYTFMMVGMNACMQTYLVYVCIGIHMKECKYLCSRHG